MPDENSVPSVTLERTINLMVPVLNARINIPGIWDEEQEAAKIRSALGLVMPALPKFTWSFLLDASNGLTDQETEKILQITLNNIARLVVAPLPSFIHPFITNQIHNAFEPIVRVVLEYAQAGANIGLDEPEGEI